VDIYISRNAEGVDRNLTLEGPRAQEGTKQPQVKEEQRFPSRLPHAAIRFMSESVLEYKSGLQPV
jgi:hypothetical protein